jgi:6,7-dimethyl-8-ribityllumazine synthase
MTIDSDQNELTGIDGALPDGKIVVVASRYNPSICDALVSGSLETLAAAGYEASQVLVIRVPGAWELPSVVARCLQHQDVIAAIALGCVIRGETSHDEHINRSVSMSLMDLGVRTGRPIAFGLLTCNTIEQAIQRSGGTVGNKGNESAEAVIELLRLSAKVDDRLQG